MFHTPPNNLPLSLRVAAQTIELDYIQITPTTVKQKLYWFIIFRPIIYKKEHNLVIDFTPSQHFEEFSVNKTSDILNKKIRLALQKNKNAVFYVYLIFDIQHYPFFSIIKMDYQIK
jgi:hypothetical protein